MLLFDPQRRHALGFCLLAIATLGGCDKTKSPEPTSAQASADAEPQAKAPEPAPEDDAEGPPAEQPQHGDEGAPDAGQTAEVGKPAPDFTLTDLQGDQHELSSHRGKIVVLEWFNPECPFVNYAHDEGPLKDMAAKETEKGVVWLAVNSGGVGRQGHGAETNEAGVKKFGMTHPLLLDESGEVGHSYGALKTPHMYVIDEEGVLRYMGAIDNAPFGKVEGGGDPVNYVAQALASLRAGKDIETTSTDSYGCTVKYAK